MNERIRETIAYGRTISEEYRRTRAGLAAGGLAYFVALSLAPAALALGTLAGLLLDPADVTDVLERLAGRAPETFDAIEPVTKAVMSTVESASASSFTITTLVGLVIAIYSASKVVLGLRMAMNSAFGVQETRGGLVERGFAAIVTLIGLVGAVAVVILLTIVPRVLDWLDLPTVPVSTGIGVLDWGIVVLGVLIVVRWLLTHGPDRRARVPWRSLGAWVATLGIMAATAGVGVYVHYSASISTAILLFGTAVVLLLWLYLCFVALLWGAVIEAHAEAERAQRGASAH